ncbi:MAG: L17 family ribosomal protein [bacterium]|jgi:ribosomal protein L17
MLLKDGIFLGCIFINRTMCTQLVEHERIRTTAGKARALRPLIEKVIALAKRNNVPS